MVPSINHTPFTHVVYAYVLTLHGNYGTIKYLQFIKVYTTYTLMDGSRWHVRELMATRMDAIADESF